MKNELSDDLIRQIIANPKIDLSKRIEILKLYNYLKKYLKINYIEKENEIYNNLGVNNKLSKIDFEIKRMNQTLEKKYPKEEYEERLNLIKNTYNLIISDTLNNIKINQERLNNLLERIVLLELDMEMKVGLYQEVDELLKKEINNLYQENYYIKKKDWFNNGTK